jgi:hypothetical protein
VRRSDALSSQVRRLVAENPRTMSLETLSRELDGCAPHAAQRSLTQP